MVASTALRERAFAAAKRLCYAGLDAPTLLSAVAGRLQGAAPFEAYCSTANDPVSGLLTHLVGHEAFGEQEQHTYLEHVYFEEDLDEQRTMARNRVPVVLLSEVTGGKLERALRYRAITGPLGLGHELLSVYAVARDQWGGLCLMRERGRPDFDAREVEVVRRLAPHVGAGLQAAALRTRATAEPDDDDVAGVLVLDDRGRVVQRTAAAERWLRDLADLGPGWLEGGGLPAVVWTVNGALRRALRPETEGDQGRVPRVHVKARSGRWLTLHGARTLPHAGRGGETMVIVEPSRPRELAWLRASAYGLSERERAVVDQVAQGGSTKVIARVLSISEYTVQEHLSHAFDKVGVRGRRALVQRLFLDNLYPALSPSSEAEPSGLTNDPAGRRT